MCIRDRIRGVCHAGRQDSRCRGGPCLYLPVVNKSITVRVAGPTAGRQRLHTPVTPLLCPLTLDHKAAQRSAAAGACRSRGPPPTPRHAPVTSLTPPARAMADAARRELSSIVTLCALFWYSGHNRDGTDTGWAGVGPLL